MFELGEVACRWILIIDRNLKTRGLTKSAQCFYFLHHEHSRVKICNQNWSIHINFGAQLYFHVNKIEGCIRKSSLQIWSAEI